MQHITLCFDFGNTRLKCAVVDGSIIKEVFEIENDSNETIQELINKYQPQKTILSSVIEHNPNLEKILSSSSRFHKLSHQTKLPFTTPVGKPETIGADRLALSAAAVYFHPQKNNLVIGLGSCITYNFINKHNQFLGGSISPGMEMRFRSLQTFTAKLPLIKAEWNFPLIGYDTKTNILSGVLLGMAKEIDGIIDAYAEKYSNFNVLLTGGDAAYFARHLKNKIFADPDLIFKGLYAISEYNDDTKT
ncbi:MAG: putative transcriptional acitvator, Baf family [Chitinophagaceae bacterium]|nr:putative transcriptional acitvator, Baf family [Chitinophagaceae bacterium]MDB5221761.1 putative transcriptional acitvator, Baf family [Chitinophagaceae bacterium]